VPDHRRAFVGAAVISGKTRYRLWKGRTMRLNPRLPNPLAVFLLAAAFALPAAAQAAVGVTEIASKAGDPVTVFYPSSAEEKALKRGLFTLNFTSQGTSLRRNGLLVVASRRSGPSHMVHSD